MAFASPPASSRRRRRFGELRGLACAAALAGLAASPSSAKAANDPYLLWESVETKHFRISYYSGEREIALRVADMAEAIHTRLTPVLGYAPSERTEIALTDQTDSANGSASALPYNVVRLYLAAPDDLSPLGDVDDWYLALLTHEYTHILHLDNIRGIPALLNAVLGKTFAPNQAQPRWITEGLAVLMESTRTSGGRLRASQWNMYMRADVLEGNLATLDRFTNTPRRWPQGNIWYLYGSFLMEYVAEVYGEAVLRKMIRDYGGQIVPWGFNRSFRRATGKTFEDIYPDWVAWLQRRYQAQADAIRARGLRQGVQLTRSGQIAFAPRLIPRAASPKWAGDVLYYREDGHSLGGLYRVPLRRDAGGRILPARDAELLVRTQGTATPSFGPEGDLVFNSNDIYNGIFVFTDLFRMPAGETSTWGLDAKRTRLSTGYRASQADVSPDGRRVVFVTNHRGTTYLQIADLDAEGLRGTRALVPSQPLEQTFSPRWSPDNRTVAYSIWRDGGYRDVRLVDTSTGAVREIMRDRAVDGGPSFSPDGKWLFFHSDRTGVMNVYAYEVETGRLRQVTNVLTGAYQPQVSADGKTLVYVGYTSKGFDLFAMDLDESAWPEAEPYVDPHPAPPPPAPPAERSIVAYNPLHTLRPRAYGIDTFPSTFGQTFRVSVSGSDIAGWHGFGASLSVETERPDPQFSVSYGYGRLPFDVSARIYRTLTPRSDVGFGPAPRPLGVQESLGAETTLSYPLNGAFDGQSVALSYSLAHTSTNVPISDNRLDPDVTPVLPRAGVYPYLSLGWSYASAARFLWSVAAEKGVVASMNLTTTHPAFGSAYAGLAVSGRVGGYLLMPWLRHHSLGLNLSGGTSTGNYPGAGPYYIGGFVEPSLFDTIRNLYVQGGIVLRGYAPGSAFGQSYVLGNAEYRFPIVNIDRGPSTLPLFFNRLTGAAFVDAGSAFDDLAKAAFKIGVGGELWLDVQLAYAATLTFRLGYARGLSEGGMDRIYFVAAAPF